MRRERSKTVVSFSAIAEGARHARELQETAASKEDLADCDPSHGCDVITQHQLSIFVEQTGAMRETLCLTDPMSDAEEECYRGHKGDIWFARALPPAIEGLDAVVITTPDVLIGGTRAGWLAYLDRTLAEYPKDRRKQVYQLLVKYGDSPRYWPEYIVKAYVNDDPVQMVRRRPMCSLPSRASTPRAWPAGTTSPST